MTSVKALEINKKLADKTADPQGNAFGLKARLDEALMLQEFSDILGKIVSQIAQAAQDAKPESHKKPENKPAQPEKPAVEVRHPLQKEVSEPAPVEEEVEEEEVVSEEPTVVEVEEAPEAEEAAVEVLPVENVTVDEPAPAVSVPVEAVEAAVVPVDVAAKPAEASENLIVEEMPVAAPVAELAMEQSAPSAEAAPSIKDTIKALFTFEEPSDKPEHTTQPVTQSVPQAIQEAADQAMLEKMPQLEAFIREQAAATAESQEKTPSLAVAEPKTRPLVSSATPQPAPAVQAAAESVDLVSAVTQELKERVSRVEVKTDVSQQPRPMTEQILAAPRQIVTATAAEFVERSLNSRFQLINPVAALEMAQNSGKEAGKAQAAIQSVISAASFTGRTDRNGREVENDRNQKQLNRTESQRTLEKVEQAIKEVARSKDGKTISVRLDPPSLGSVKVDLTYREGVLHARIVAEQAQVATLLREKAHEIQTLMRRLGLDAQRVSVSVGQDPGSLSSDAQAGAREWAERAENREAYGLVGESRKNTGASDERQAARTPTDHWVA